jgi:hypothetical protein
MPVNGAIISTFPWTNGAESETNRWFCYGSARLIVEETIRSGIIGGPLEKSIFLNRINPKRLDCKNKYDYCDRSLKLND